MSKNGTDYFYHLNAHGDVIRITDSEGDIVASYDYDAWGNIINKSGVLADANPYRYSEYRYDNSTGLYYLKARYYNPSEYRFLTLDSANGNLESPLEQNGYSYADNNPVSYSDDNGESGKGDLVRILGKFALKGAKAAFKSIKKGKTTVYISRTKNNVVQYVGITKNFARRSTQHLKAKNIQITPLIQNLSRSSARAVEQALIEYHKLGKNGGTLLNKINSMSKNNPKYAKQIKLGRNILRMFGYKID